MLQRTLRSVFSFDDSDFGLKSREKHVNVFIPEQRKQFFRVLIADQEIDLHSQIAGELEKVLLVNFAVTAEPGDRAERRAAVYAEFFRPLEQPLVKEDAVVSTVFVHVERQKTAFHAASSGNSNRTA